MVLITHYFSGSYFSCKPYLQAHPLSPTCQAPQAKAKRNDYCKGVQTEREFTAIDALAERYYQQKLDTSPETVTYTGIAGAPETQLDDVSPDGIAAQVDLARATLRELATLPEADATDRVTAAGLRERLGLEIELFEAGESVGELNNLASPVQGISEVFDVMARETREDWETIAQRLQAVPGALAGYQTSLSLRLEKGPVFPLRQVTRCIEQAEQAASPTGSFAKLREAGMAAQPDTARALQAGEEAARRAYGELAQFLRERIAPHAVTYDAVGRDRYALHSREFLGATVDLDAAYEWGLHELRRIDRAQRKIAKDLYGDGVSVREAMHRLDQEERYTLNSVAELQAWMQKTADEAMEAVQKYFDIPEPMRTIECMIAPSDSGAIYYTGPSDDFSRPGRMWWSVPTGVTKFSTWQEKTTVFHEGVPGHHLQLGLAVYLKGMLNTWRRQAYWVSGHGEGWALYAEQLMAELGFQSDLGDRMGVLDSERLRAARIIVDMGVHLGKDSGDWAKFAVQPAGSAYEPARTGKPWDHASAWEFLRENVAMEESFLAYELDRYLGWPGQASSYKIGQRIWNELRDHAREEKGSAFNLKDWHMQALSLGGVGLDVLRQELA
ncbi:Bacterial protein of uncharacterised function (DUF885) [Actinobaculum suis]|uniref:Bacterial protein of uncharacterized function (DUF885) n=1 Tax=Actinobaculum suis TaxID=1657 RepID=A0A7Z9C815_9ACTO|nr:Bacterial protein of uncharacterised function (DUF885) [Actinobaculum suis]